MADILSTLLQTIPAVKTGLEGRNNKNQKRVTGQMEGLVNAQYNPDNPIFQRLYGQNRDMAQRDIASAVSEISRQNRKLTSLGRRPLLDQERGGETVFRNLILGQEDVGNQARESTFRQIGNAQQGLNLVNNNYGDLADEDYMNKVRRVGAYYSIGDALKGMFNL